MRSSLSHIPPAREVCPVLGLGLLLSFVLASVLSRAPFADYEAAFAAQLPLTLTADAGCLAGIGIVAALRGALSSAETRGYTVAVSCMGLGFSSLVKSGVLPPQGDAGLLAGDFLTAAFVMACFLLWCSAIAPSGERIFVRTLASASIIAVALFIPIALAPSGVARIVMGVAIPTGMCACFWPSVAPSAPISNETDGSNNGARARKAGGEGPVPASLPPLALGLISLSFLVCDPMLDLFTVSLFFDDVVAASLNQPALICVAIVAGGAIALIVAARRGPVPLRPLYCAGFLLTAIGYLAMPFRPMNGFPLGISEAGRIAICAFALIVVVRFLESNDAMDAGTPLRVLAKTCAAAFGVMLACDAVVVAMQLIPGFDYNDFVVRTAFSMFGVGLLVVLLLGPLPRIEAIISPTPLAESDGGATAKAGVGTLDDSAAASGSLGERCASFARAYGLTARETEILSLIAAGRDVPYIERELVVAKSTVKTHVKHIYAKCGVSSRQDLLDLLEKF